MEMEFGVIKNVNTRKCMGYPTCRLYDLINASKPSFTECNDVSYLFLH